MKHMLNLAVLPLVFACSKNDKHPDRETLSGKWKLTANAYSAGGAIEENKVDPAKAIVIDFRADSSFTSTNTDNHYNRYSIDVNNQTVTLTGPGATTSSLRFKVQRGTLILTPVNPVCIEGCFSKYTALH